MPPSSFSAPRRWLPHAVRVLALVVLLALSLVLPVSAATAHDTLVSSDPARDAVLDSAPDRVTLTFSAELLDLPTSMAVRDADGEVVAEGAPTVEGESVILNLPDTLPGGTYEVRWSVVSSDGHRTEDGYKFTITPEGGAAPNDGGSPTPTETAPPPQKQEDEVSPEAQHEGEARPAPGLPTWRSILWWQAGILAFAVVTAMAYRWWRNR